MRRQLAAGKWAFLARHQPGWCTAVNFPASRIVKNTFLLLINYPVFGVLFLQLRLTKSRPWDDWHWVHVSKRPLLRKGAFPFFCRPTEQRDAQYPPPSVTSCGWPACHQASHQGNRRCSLGWTGPQLSGQVLLDTKTPRANPVGGNAVDKGIVSQGQSFETFWTQQWNQAPSFYNSYCHKGQSTSVEIMLISRHSAAGEERGKPGTWSLR